MRYGFVMSSGTAREVAEAADLAEQSGWDAIFTWEATWGQDAWVTLTAAAMLTTRIRLGTMLTPLPRVRPWDLAGKVATLDDLSGGRVQLAVGLGALHENWLAFEADEGRRVRAEKLDEGLAVYDGLMRGQPFTFSGKHYSASPTTLMAPPAPVQQPRVPVWVVGAWPSEKSLGRAARWDGLLPATVNGKSLTPELLRDVVERVAELRAEAGLPWAGYDVVVEGTTRPGSAAVEEVSRWAAAGATWWVESDWDVTGPDATQRLRERIAHGPPGRR